VLPGSTGLLHEPLHDTRPLNDLLDNVCLSELQVTQNFSPLARVRSRGLARSRRINQIWTDKFSDLHFRRVDEVS
jgi:hypothetical protein